LQLPADAEQSSGRQHGDPQGDARRHAAGGHLQQVDGSGATLTKQQKQELEAIEIQKNNAAVDQLHAVADRFNTQVKIFKARDKKSDSN
jgi:hypothetical protein